MLAARGWHWDDKGGTLGSWEGASTKLDEDPPVWRAQPLPVGGWAGFGRIVGDGMPEEGPQAIWTRWVSFKHE